MEEKVQNHVVVPLLSSMPQEWKDYAHVIFQLDKLKEAKEKLNQRKKELEAQLKPHLQNAPSLRQKFEVNLLDPVDKASYGSSFVGVRINSRKRDQAFNGKNFKPAVEAKCIPLFYEHFPDAQKTLPVDRVRSFANKLAENVWAAREFRYEQEIVPIRRVDPNAPKKESAAQKKRKQESISGGDAQFNPSQKAKVEEVENEEEEDDF